MPSAAKRKRILSMENSLSPKRGKSIHKSESPHSSPIKGPLKEHAETNSSSFVAKCFYGLKKRGDNKVKTVSTPNKRKRELYKGSHNLNKVTLEKDKTKSISNIIEQLMDERIAASPIKQRLLETVSKTEFRRVYKDEYKELEELALRESRAVTRRTSKIVISRGEESDDDDLSSSDDEMNREVNLNGLDCESEENSVSDTQGKQSFCINKEENEICSESDSVDDCRDETVVEHAQESMASCTHNDKFSMEETVPSQKQTNSSRKIFKTRTPAAKPVVVVKKGFNLKISKTSPVLNKLGKNKKKKSESSKAESGILKGCNYKSTDLGGNKSFTSNTGPDVASSSPHSGFWFAPGFLSPEQDKCESPQNPLLPNNCEAASVCNDEDLSLNKCSHTYELRTPSKRVANNTDTSPASSGRSSMGSVALICSEKEGGGSQDLFSSQQDSNPQGTTSPGNEETAKNLPESPQDSLPSDKTSNDSGKKLFPVFTKKISQLSRPNHIKRSPVAKTTLFSSPRDTRQSQMFLDAGQKKFGATQCPVCSMVYCHADPEDEAAHGKFHRRLLEILKYTGSKKDRVLQEYPDDFGKVILVLPEDSKSIRKKVEDVSQVMSQELGFPDGLTSPFINRQQKVFLYVLEKEIAGCCIAEPIQKGFRIIPGDLDTSEVSGQRPWRCSDVEEPASVGISRLWVAATHRKSGIATKLVDCVRQWFEYGLLIHHHLLAFSDPTPDGRMFAQKYMRSNTFLVYKYNSGHLEKSQDM